MHIHLYICIFICMERRRKAIIGCLNIGDFEAWARLQQGKKGRQIAVHHRDRITSRTRALRVSGLEIGESLERTKVLFPDAILHEHDHVFETEVWESVIRRLYAISPYIEPSSIGTSFFRPYQLHEIRSLAGRLKAGIGIAHSRSISRIASIRSAPGGLLDIKSKNIDSFLQNTKIDILTDLGFEKELPERFRLFGLTNLYSLQDLTRRHLVAQFGEVGMELHGILHPDENEHPVLPYIPPPVVSTTFDLDHPAREPMTLYPLLDLLIQRNLFKLEGMLCKRIRVQAEIHKSTGRPYEAAQRILKEPTDNQRELRNIAERLLLTLISRGDKELDLNETSEVVAEKGIIGLTVTMGLLTPPNVNQGRLFFERPAVLEAVEDVEVRFPGGVLRPVILHKDAAFPEDRMKMVAWAS